jgi:hypothetical protein
LLPGLAGLDGLLLLPGLETFLTGVPEVLLGAAIGRGGTRVAPAVAPAAGAGGIVKSQNATLRFRSKNEICFVALLYFSSKNFPGKVKSGPPLCARRIRIGGGAEFPEI